MPDLDPEMKESKPATMSLLAHLEELRRRLFWIALVFLGVFGVCWTLSPRILTFLLKPIREHLFDGGDIVFIDLVEPFMIYMKGAALAALFLSFPFILFQFWGFVAPGLYKRERRWFIPFMFFGTLFFVAGGVFAYLVALPVAAGWLIRLGEDFTATLTLRSAFQFESRLILGMGAVFEMPIVIMFLARMGVVTPAFLMRYFRQAVLIIAVLAAVITPTGDMMTMTVFAGPMVLLYLLGVALAWLVRKRGE